MAGGRVSGVVRAGVGAPAAKPLRVTDEDVDAALARLDRQLDELQAELHAPPRVEAAAPTPTPAPRVEVPADRPEPLEQFGIELRRLADELVAAYDRVLVEERRRRSAPRTIVLESDADLHALADLERALDGAPHVADVALREYAGGRASLTVEFEPRG